MSILSKRKRVSGQYMINERLKNNDTKPGEPVLRTTHSPKIDVSLVEHTLTMSPEERVDSHEAARQLVKDLQNAGKAHYEGQS